MEQPYDLLARAVLLIHRAKECRRRYLARLVDANYQHVFLAHAYFDPAAPFRYYPAAVKHTVAFLALDKEIHARASVKLIYYNPLGTVDDEFAAADHRWHFAKIDRLLRNILAVFLY